VQRRGPTAHPWVAVTSSHSAGRRATGLDPTGNDRSVHGASADSRCHLRERLVSCVEQARLTDRARSRRASHLIDVEGESPRSRYSPGSRSRDSVVSPEATSDQSTSVFADRRAQILLLTPPIRRLGRGGQRTHGFPDPSDALREQPDERKRSAVWGWSFRAIARKGAFSPGRSEPDRRLWMPWSLLQ
jgi:hypothetical protein